MDEYTVSYDYRDYDYEERGDWEPAEREEYSQYEDKESFINYVKKQSQKYGKKEPRTEPKSGPRDFADGLDEWVHKKAGRSISEDFEKNVEDDMDSEKSFAELQAEIDERLIEEYNTPEYREKVIREAVEFYSNIPMYDFGLGKMSNEKDMLDFYGRDIVRRIREEIEESRNLPKHRRKVGQISQKLWQELRDIRAGRLPHPKSTGKKKKTNKRPSIPQNSAKKDSKSDIKPKKKKSKEIEIIQRKRQPGDDYFLKIERGVIRNKSYRKLFKGPGTVYEWIWANLVRSEWIDTKGYPIKEKYYDRGFLAYCSSPEKIGKNCGGMSKNTVEKYIKEFEGAGIIKVDYLVREGNTKGQRVYILGEWKEVNGKRVERFYRDEVFISEKPVKN